MDRLAPLGDILRQRRGATDAAGSALPVRPVYDSDARMPASRVVHRRHAQEEEEVPIEARLDLARWFCATCRCTVEPRVRYVAGMTLVHRQSCMCGEPAPGQPDPIAALRAVLEQRDIERAHRYFTLPGAEALHSGMPVWHKRFTLQTKEDDTGLLLGGEPFDLERDDMAADAMAQVLAWASLVRQARAEAARAAEAQIGQGAVNGALAYEDACDVEWRRARRAHDLLRTALRHIPSCLLVGGHGSGKTHLALAAYHALIDGDIAVLYVSAPTFLAALHSCWGRDDAGMQEERYISRLIAAQVLVLDDVGREEIRPRTTAIWERVLRERDNRGLPALVVAQDADLADTALGSGTYDLFAVTVQLYGDSQRAAVDSARLVEQGVVVSGQLHPPAGAWAAALASRPLVGASSESRALPAPPDCVERTGDTGMDGAGAPRPAQAPIHPSRLPQPSAQRSATRRAVAHQRQRQE